MVTQAMKETNDFRFSVDADTHIRWRILRTRKCMTNSQLIAWLLPLGEKAVAAEKKKK